MGNLTKYECHNYIQYAVGVISVLIKAGRKTAEEQFGGSTDTHVLFLSLTLSQRVSHESDVSFRIESLAYIGITCNDLFTDVHLGFTALHLVKYPFYSFLYCETVTLRLVLASYFFDQGRRIATSDSVLCKLSRMEIPNRQIEKAVLHSTSEIDLV